MKLATFFVASATDSKISQLVKQHTRFRAKRGFEKVERKFLERVGAEVRARKNPHSWVRDQERGRKDGRRHD
jgi:hypothetical protein